MTDSQIRAVDLFCGAGGTLEGLAQYCDDAGHNLKVTAVNHWETAIETHQRNHPNGNHHISKVEELHPPNVVDGDTIDILIAAPECTHFSTARGGKPVSEQKRASPWHVLDWVEKLRPQNVLLENVPELESWGPVDEDGQPTRNGEIFETWINAFHALGYSIDWTKLNAADYGDATSRRRLFVVGRRGQRAEFPDPTHSKDGAGDTEEWRSAAEIIDWSDPGESIWQRSRPLVNNTMQRIAEGIRRHCDETLEPFADAIADLEKSDVEQMQDDVVAIDDIGEIVEERCEPFLVKYYGTSTAISVDEPVDTITANGGKFALCSPTMVMGQQSNARALDATEEPLPTVATRGAIHYIDPDPFVLPRNGAFRGLHSNPAYDPDERPLHTVTAKNSDGHVVTPYLVPYYSEAEGQAPRTHDIKEPLPTITATGSDPYLTQPYLVSYHGNDGSKPIDEPLPTVTTKDRFALVVPEMFPFGIDIRYRMLQPRELAAAMGFPSDYEFAGNKTQTTKQIGNAVPVNLARALCEQLLTGNEPSLATFSEQPGTAGATDDD